jgi:hypothetical protein
METLRAVAFFAARYVHPNNIDNVMMPHEKPTSSGAPNRES